MTETFSFESQESAKAPKNWRELLGSPWQIGLLILGTVLLVAGSVAIISGREASESAVEIISSDEGTSSSSEIVVDVSGAVERPGVYTLASGARLTDALSAAGGFSEEADRVWVERYVNLAQQVPDGAKVYIPAEGETYSNEISNDKFLMSNESTMLGLGSSQSGLVSVNSASGAELESLAGIGEKRAEAIINNRPYSSIEEIREKAGIPESVFEEIKDQLTL